MNDAQNMREQQNTHVSKCQNVAQTWKVSKKDRYMFFRRVKEEFLGKKRLSHLFKRSHYLRRVPLKALKQAR